MFNGIEFILGVACSLMGIVGGYIFLTTIFAGLQLMSNNRLMKHKVAKTLDT